MNQYSVELVKGPALLPIPGGGQMRRMVALGWVINEIDFVCYGDQTMDVPGFSWQEAKRLENHWNNAGYEAATQELALLEPLTPMVLEVG